MVQLWDLKLARVAGALRAAPDDVRQSLKREALELAVELATAAVNLSIDCSAYLVGRVYATMLPDELRSSRGVFYTPPPVVTRLLELLDAAGVDWSRCRVLEPACGGGAFLGPLARRMARAIRGADRRVLARNLRSRLTGYEIDPFSAWLSTAFLDAAVAEETGAPVREDLASIEVCDSLDRVEEDAFDLVIANPPYGRVSLSAERRAAFKRSLYGHANLYGLFLDLALRKTRPGGVIAYVTPTGFLCGEYFKKLRGLLSDQAPPAVLDLLSEREGIFDDVLQEALLAVFRRGGTPGQIMVNFVRVDSTGLSVEKSELAPLPEERQTPWIVARSADMAPFAARLRTMPARLADWGYQVSTGPLVWNRHKKQLRHEPGKGTVPLLWAECVGADGTFEFRAARRNHAPYFAAGKDDGWLLVKRPCVLLQRTTAKEQARRLIAAELPASFLDRHGRVTVENHLNMIIPIVPEPAVDARTLAAFLNSSAADQAFRCISGTVAVSAYELEAMPLPPAWRLQDLSQLAGQANRGEIDRHCARLYGER